MTEVAQDKLQSEGGLVDPADEEDVDGPAELAEEGDGEDDDVHGSLTGLLFGAEEHSLPVDFDLSACKFGINMDRSEERLSLELLFENASSCCCW